LIAVALRSLPLDSPGVSETIQITVDVPLGYPQRDQLLSFMEEKFPGANISVVHTEVDTPMVSEALVRHDSTAEPAETASTASGQDSGSVLTKASDALSGFLKSNG
jgi:hypothetical protein